MTINAGMGVVKWGPWHTVGGSVNYYRNFRNHFGNLRKKRQKEIKKKQNYHMIQVYHFYFYFFFLRQGLSL